MSDAHDLNATDHEQINVNEPIGLRAWAARFGVNEDEVVAAVDAVGTDAAEVNKHLRATVKKMMPGRTDDR